MAMEVVHEDMGDEDYTQCTNHPYKNTTLGGICAFCLQEKLGSLISSSISVPVFPSFSSPSLRSNLACTATAASDGAAVPALQLRQLASSAANSQNGNIIEGKNHERRSSRLLPFVLTHKKKVKNDGVIKGSSDSTSIVLKRSKSIATPRRRGLSFLNENEDYSPNKRGFWSFLYMPKKSGNKQFKDLNFTVGSSSVAVNGGEIRSREKKIGDFDEINWNPNQVSRSRSVGCGSKSFSGDFLEGISTGVGDCSNKNDKVQSSIQRSINGQDCIRRRIRCGGIFSGFMMASSSSSSSCSSDGNVSGKSISAAHKLVSHISTGRSKNWRWAFVSPMRAFGKSSALKRDDSLNKSATPNLTAVPSLLA